MVYRLSWIAGLAGMGFALARAERLLRASTDGLPWQVVLVAAAIIGAAITWAGVAYRLPGAVIAAVNSVAAILTVVRVAVPHTTWFVFPTADSVVALGKEMTFARDVIRSGIAPVIPIAGIIAIMAVVFWAMGALLTWGLLTGRPYVAVVTPLVVYLEFAVMDRRPSGWWTTAFMVLIGLCLIAVNLDRRRLGTGVASSGSRRLVRSLPSVGLVTLVVTTLLATYASAAVTQLVPRSGYLDWRAPTGLSGDFYGSISYNPFVGIRQQLISQSDVPVFVASVEGEVAPTDLYWRLVSLDAFDGTQWHLASGTKISRPADLDSFEDPNQAFSGDTEESVSEVTILALQQDWLPAPYATVGMTARNSAVASGYRVRIGDGSLRFDALSYRGMVYTVESRVPKPDLDVLGRLPEGTPSIVFRTAIEAAEYALSTDAPLMETRVLPDEAHFLELPDDLDPRITSLARSTTANLQTNFEKALALESFFRNPGSFSYSTAVVPGHGADDLAAWLLEPDSDNYRTGYCEQFSTAMAVMARLVGIPSRVILGFAPGTLLEDGRVVIRDRNAHAWVELWMPTQGWVRFDPTPRGDGINPATLSSLPFDIEEFLNVPAPEAPSVLTGPVTPGAFRNEGLEEPAAPPEIVAEEAPSQGPEVPPWFLPVTIIAAALVGLVPAVKWFRRRRRLARLNRGEIDAAWREIVDRLSDLGEPPSPTETSSELAKATAPALAGLADVYGEWAYGPGGVIAPERIDFAERSLTATEKSLSGIYPLLKRIRSRYSFRSLRPSWWGRRKSR